VGYGMSFAQGGRVRVELYRDRTDQEWNKWLFDRLETERGKIEEEFGETLDWERLPDRRASRIAVYRVGSIESDEGTLSGIRSWGIERLLKFKKIFLPRLSQYGKSSKPVSSLGGPRR